MNATQLETKRDIGPKTTQGDCHWFKSYADDHNMVHGPECPLCSYVILLCHFRGSKFEVGTTNHACYDIMKVSNARLVDNSLL